MQRFGQSLVPIKHLLGGDSTAIDCTQCSYCKRFVVWVEFKGFSGLAKPRSSARPPLHHSVQPELAADYAEAALVLAMSPKASAALSRRCLQTLLRLQGHTQRNLDEQIKAAYATFPSYTQTLIDAIRKIGNLSAHPKWNMAGEIVDVEEHEAEFTLDLLDSLFDHYYVKPDEHGKKLAAIQAKLQDTSGSP